MQWEAPCKERWCQCKDEPQAKRAADGKEDRLKLLARDAKNVWKMARTYNEIPSEELEDCGSCDLSENEWQTDSKGKKTLVNAALSLSRKRGQRPVEWKKIYYINLDDAVDRKNRLMQDLSTWSQGIPIQRFPAINRAQAKTFNMSHFTDQGFAKYVNNYGEKSKWGTVAVYLSHASLLEKIHREDPQGEGLYVILEDDAKLLHNDWWKRHVETLIQDRKVPEDWDMLKIGFWGSTRCQDFVSEEVLEANAPGWSLKDGTNLYGGNVAYIVRPKSVPVILEQLRGQDVHDIDGAFMSLHKEGIATGDDDLKYYWSWGAHTYALKQPVVFGGLNSDSSRL